MNVPAGLEYDCFLHYESQLEDAETLVALTYADFCTPARSTKHYIEELALEHGFYLMRFRVQNPDPEVCGEALPIVQVYVDKGTRTLPGLFGAQTKARLIEYLKEHGVIPQ